MNSSVRLLRITRRSVLLAAGVTFASCVASDAPPASSAERPTDVPSLHHVGLNTTDADAAIAWYLSLWPTATRDEMDGQPAVASEMYLVFREVDEPPPGAFDATLGRATEQSAFWHIGAFANTTDGDESLGAIGVEHLPLYTSPTDSVGVWRSGLTPYDGILGAEALVDADAAAPRPGGFSYVLAPDGVLFELTGGPGTTPSMSHVHFFQEAPRCAANWYVELLGMSLPPVRADDGSTTPAPLHEPCEEPAGEAGWPSLEQVGTIRQPRGTVIHGSGNMSWYPRQCRNGRCGSDQPLVPSRGQALDHLAFVVDDVAAWYGWLSSQEVTVIEPPHPFDGGLAVMFEGPDRLAIELVERPR